MKIAGWFQCQSTSKAHEIIFLIVLNTIKFRANPWPQLDARSMEMQAARPASGITAETRGREVQRLGFDCRSTVGLEESCCFTMIPKPRIRASERRGGEACSCMLSSEHLDRNLWFAFGFSFGQDHANRGDFFPLSDT